MTVLTIVSAYTVIPQGRVDLGKVILDETTVRDVKLKIRQRIHDDRCEAERLSPPTQEADTDEDPIKKYMLWWRGYRLDKDDLTLLQACIGVSEGESLNRDHTESLVLFLTLPLERTNSNDSSNSGTLSPTLVRSFSDLVSSVRQELTPTATTAANKAGKSLAVGCNIV
jgi:hypothetical protein